MSVDVVTFGCRLNTYELEVIRMRAGRVEMLLWSTLAR